MCSVTLLIQVCSCSLILKIQPFIFPSFNLVHQVYRIWQKLLPKTLSDTSEKIVSSLLIHICNAFQLNITNQSVAGERLQRIPT